MCEIRRARSRAGQRCEEAADWETFLAVFISFQKGLWRE